MITPENKIPFDDSQNLDAEDQESQKDIHSNGLDTNPVTQNEQDANPEMLKQAYDAATPSYTLDLGEDKEETAD